MLNVVGWLWMGDGMLIRARMSWRLCCKGCGRDEMKFALCEACRRDSVVVMPCETKVRVMSVAAVSVC